MIRFWAILRTNLSEPSLCEIQHTVGGKIRMHQTLRESRATPGQNDKPTAPTNTLARPPQPTNEIRHDSLNTLI